MLLFSTLLSIKKTMTEDDFIRLVIEWNQENPHPDNVIPGIVWNGERNIRYGDENLWLEIIEYHDKNIIAVRYEKRAADGAVWDTDYVMNFHDMILAIRLDRSYLESALSINPNFSAPHFIKLLIDKGYLIDDDDLAVSYEPHIVEDDELQKLAAIINEERKYRLPIVYVSKTYSGENPVDVQKMAKKLKGIAHVLVQKGGWQNSELRELTDDRNEFYGAVGIYYPNQAMEHRKFLYRLYEGRDNALMEKVISSVIHYSNLQMVDMLYTWSGVNNSLLRDRYSSKEKERLAAEYETAKTRDEADQLIASVDEEILRLRQQIERLTNANDALTLENTGLRMKLDASSDVPVIFYGEEEEFFHGEISDMILNIISEALRNTQCNTRRYDVLSDILAKNNYEGLLDSKASEVKTVFRDYKTLSSATRQFLKDLGFTITEDGKHYRLTYYGDGRYNTTIAKTGSDHREGKNIASTIIKNML